MAGKICRGYEKRKIILASNQGAYEENATPYILNVKGKTELNWEPKVKFENGIVKTSAGRDAALAIMEWHKGGLV